MSDFNQSTPSMMHIDLNSCFATIEQQANPLLRGKPIAVAAYDTLYSCIIAPSVEAKKLGIKVGMRVKEGKSLCPDLLILPPDPWKYRAVHQKLKKLLGFYTDSVTPKSIDEFVLDFTGTPCLKSGLAKTAFDIKKKIKERVGEYITVSIGIGPNRFLAKTASNLHKPDGLDEINKDNFLGVYQKLSITDLCGIKAANARRLSQFDILTVTDFYTASKQTLRAVFSSICGYYWHLRLHGFEIDTMEFKRGSFGNSYILPQTISGFNDIQPILVRLCQKSGFRMRNFGYYCRGVHLVIWFRDRNFWHESRNFGKNIFDSRDIFKAVLQIMSNCPYRSPVQQLAVSCFDLGKSQNTQLDMFGSVSRQKDLVEVIDKVNKKWGDFCLVPASMVGMEDKMPDRIAFGGVREL